MLRTILFATLIGLSSCYAEAEYPGPTVAYVDPGIEVVTDLDYPVFFVDGLYWRWYGGFWYRSYYWDRGWGYVAAPPPRIRGINHPGGYAHYHPGASHPSRPAPRAGGGVRGGGGGHHR